MILRQHRKERRPTSALCCWSCWGSAAVAHIANRIFVPTPIPVVLPIAFLLNGIGYVMILRIDLAKGHDYAPLQAAWTAGGVAAYVLTLAVIRRSRDLDRYRYLLLVGGVVLLLLPLVPHFGENLNGARLWVHVGKFQFQPVELAKIVLASSSPPTSPRSGSC